MRLFSKQQEGEIFNKENKIILGHGIPYYALSKKQASKKTMRYLWGN